MKLATLRLPAPAGRPHPTAAVRIDAEHAIEIGDHVDLGSLLAEDDWREQAEGASGAQHDLATIEPGRWAPVVPAPTKVICVGMNYRDHIAEMGRDAPEHPTLFAKYADSLIGAYDPIDLPRVSSHIDWEAELAVIIGATTRRASEQEAEAAIAGYTVFNDVSARDYQYRTPQWLQGKTFDNTTPLGPYLVTTDEWQPGAGIRSEVDGEVMQDGSTGDLVFSPAALISYISEITTLRPGDVIATGTPAGVGHAQTPPRYLVDGSTLVTEIDGLGRQENRAQLAP